MEEPDGGMNKRNGNDKLASRSQDSQAAAFKKRQQREANQKYGRGKSIAVKNIKDKKLRTKLKSLEEKYAASTLKSKDAEILLENQAGFLEAEGDLERTYKLRQDEIKHHVSVETTKKAFELKLDIGGGPYNIDYTRNGRSLLLAGRNGHIASMDWRAGKLTCELQVGETVRDARWLHNSLYFATAQAKHVYIYDHQGTELHKLKNQVEPLFLEFLPYHFILASVGKAGHLSYMDTSTSQQIIDIHTKLGEPTSFSQNPYSAILNVGHHNGSLSMYSPNATTPLVKILAHKGPVRASAVDRTGKYLITAGQDCQVSVFDIRTYRELNKWFSRRPATSLSISDRDLVAVGAGTQTSVWRGLFSHAKSDGVQEKVKSPYLNWGGDGKAIECLRWVPFEDLLGVGYDTGVSNVIVPGAGEANPDALETNIFETTKQRQEAEVKALLNKLRPEMISLNPDFVGNLDLASHETKQKEKGLTKETEDPILKLKNRARGKNSSLNKYLRKKSKGNVIDERRERIEALKRQTYERTHKNPQDDTAEELGPALARFIRKKA